MGFILTDYGETKLFEITSFKETGLVSHGFTTRLGGTGTEPYDTLNLDFHVGDNPDTVIANRQVICRVLGAEIDRIVAARQVHGTNMEVVDLIHAGKGAYSYDTALPATDGLITNRAGLLLSTFYADCVPIIILEPLKKVVANIHAGWKGTVARIGALAVKKMAEAYGSNPGDLLAGIGPSIGPCCFEVGESVIEPLKKAAGWWPDVLVHPKHGGPRLDLWETNRRILTETGVKAENIESAHVCTCCNRQLLFSHRGEGGVTGRIGAFIMLGRF